MGRAHGRGRRCGSARHHRRGPTALGRRGEPTRFPIARLRHTRTTGLWSIYWRDRNLKFHEYTRKRPSKNVQSLLDWIEDSSDPIFWG